MRKATKSSQAGFTIVELMISISVLAVVLLVVTIGIIQISKSYYKGVIQATTQQTARAALDDIAQSVEFDSVHNSTAVGTPRTDLPVTPVQAYCIGQSQRYSYVLGYEQSTTKLAPTDGPYSQHILWKDQNPGSCAPVKINEESPTGTTGQGHELIGANMRLTNLSITPVTGSTPGDTNLYKVSLTVMYGDDDLIDKSSGVMATWRCKIQGGVFGAAFCAKSELTTIVGKRLS